MDLNALADVEDINSVVEQYNALVTKYGKTNIINPDTFYSKQLLDTIRLDEKHYMYYRYAKVQTMAGPSNKLQVRRWAPLQAHTIPLIEGVPPTSDKGSVEVYELEADQFGRYMEFTDKVNFKIVDPIMAHYTREYSMVAMETLDLLARETLFSIGNKIYAGYVAGYENLLVTSKPSMTDLRKITLSLKRLLVKPINNQRYHVIAGPEFYFDMVTDSVVEKFMTINQSTKTMYDNTKLVPLFDMEFYETLACPTHGKFTAIDPIDGEAKQAIRLYALTTATYSYMTIYADTVIKTATDSVGITPVAGKRAAGYVLDARTGQAASYIPADARTIAQGAEVTFDLDAFNAVANAVDGTLTSVSVGNGGKVWYEFKAQRVLILGQDALIRTGIAGKDGVQVFTKPLGSAGVLDPINQRQSIGFKIDSVGFGSARTEAINEYICVPSLVNVI